MNIVEMREKRAKLWATMEGSDTHRNDKGVFICYEDDSTYTNMEKELSDLTNEIRRMERRKIDSARTFKTCKSADYRKAGNCRKRQRRSHIECL